MAKRSHCRTHSDLPGAPSGRAATLAGAGLILALDLALGFLRWWNGRVRQVATSQSGPVPKAPITRQQTDCTDPDCPHASGDHPSASA